MPRPPKSELSLRPARAGDEAFLRACYAETRAREMEAAGWPEAARAAFLQSQFAARQASYRQAYPDAAFDVVLARGRPVGALTVARRPGGWHVIDIVLAAGHRGKGWGTTLLRQVCAGADGVGVPVRLCVDAHTTAGSSPRWVKAA